MLFVFSAAGAPKPVHFYPDDILVQEYPFHDKILFLFCKKCRGEEKIVPYTFTLDPRMTMAMALNGDWLKTGNA